MSFRENLLKKIRINALADKVLSSIGPPDSGLKLDKAAMRELLEMSPYVHRKERDLDLYVAGDAQQEEILVLDNELPVYKTTVADVALRKSPYIKEMVSIRNIIKILNDSDVKISRKEASVKIIQKACVDSLDLAYNESDIAEIVNDGTAALGSKYAAGVQESLMMLADLLEYRPPPKAFRIRHHDIFGALTAKGAGELVYGPIIIFSRIDNTLKLIASQIGTQDTGQLAFYQQVTQGNAQADITGPDVFLRLKNLIMKQDA